MWRLTTKKAVTQITGSAGRAASPEVAPPVGLKLAQRRRQDTRERINARTSEEKRKGDHQLCQGILEAALANVEPMRNMNKENRANHHDYDAGGTNAKKHPRKDSQPARNLRQADQITNNHRDVQKSGEVLRTRPTKGAEQYRAAVVKKRSSTNDA